MVKNNYSSGRNDDRLLNPNGKNEPQEFVSEQEDGEHYSDVLPCHPYNQVCAPPQATPRGDARPPRTRARAHPPICPRARARARRLAT